MIKDSAILNPPESLRDGSNSRKVFIKTYGLSGMNVYDSTRMSDCACGDGYVETEDMEEADLSPPQHLPYPREGGREGLFGAGAPARHEEAQGSRRSRDDDWRHRLRRAGRGEERKSCAVRPAVDVVIGPQT